MLAAMAVLAVLLAFGTALAMFLNGTGILRFQLMTATLYAVGGLVAKIVMARRFGIAGVAWAAALSCLVLSIAPTTLLLPRVLAKLRRASGPKESPS
jgi:hypothetical protein